MPDMSLPEELPAETPGVPADAGLPIPPIPDMPLPEESADGIEATDVTEVDEGAACADEAEKRFSANCSS